MKRPRYIYGIDFGTTNSALAILDVHTFRIVKLFTMPSLLFFPDADRATRNVECRVGEQALEGYLANRMQGRFMKSIKRILPRKRFKNTRIGSRLFTAEELVALIIAHLKEKADRHVSEKITTAVIGRPVVFDEDPESDAMAQARLTKAATMAGLEKIHFQMEPIGAAFTYERGLVRDELVLVADFGGGTSDFTLMRLSPNSIGKANRAEDMIAKSGIYIGGDSFDAAIMWERGTPHFGKGLEYESRPGKWLPIPITFYHNICTWEKMNFFDSILIRREVESYYRLSGRRLELANLVALIENNLGYTIFQKVERTKIELSSAAASTFSFHQSTIDFDEHISRTDFEMTIIKKDLDRIETFLDTFLQNTGVTAQQIDTVFMTGGTSLVTALRNRFARRFGPEKIKSGDDFHSVAMGLAYSFPLFESLDQ